MPRCGVPVPGYPEHLPVSVPDPEPGPDQET